MDPEHQCRRWGKLGGNTQGQVVLDLGRQVAGTPLLPVLEEVNQGPGPQGERPESHSGGCSGTVWPVLEGHPPSQRSQALWSPGLGSESCQAFLPTSALKAARRSCGDTPLKPLPPSLPNPQLHHPGPTFKPIITKHRKQVRKTIHFCRT